jgi:dephospho-CoA kinase
MFVIGLTGGIATGKTLVSETLRDLGATIINADLVGHEAYLPHTETWQAVVDAFGTDILDSEGQIVRPKLGVIVFSDPARLEQLNSIVHPRIYAMIGDRIESLKVDGVGAVVVEAALLIEAGWTPLVDEVWVITSPMEEVYSRLTGRGLSPDQARARIESQMPQEERVTHADVVIVNDSGQVELRSAVRQQWDQRIASRVQGDR